MHQGESSGDNRPAECVLSRTYDDDLVRTDQGWRISRRRLHAFGPGSSLSIGWMPKALAPAIGTQLYGPGDS